MTTDEINALLKRFAAENESQMINSIIKENKPYLDNIYRSWLEYKGEVKIKSRTLEIGNEHKINNKIPNDFRGLIVDQAVGYMFGNPVNYKIDAESQDDFKKFLKRIRIDDLDATAAVYMGACGRAVRMAYLDGDGQINLINVNPWEFIFIYDGSTDALQYAVRYYDVDYYEGNERSSRRKVEWYSKTEITYYISTNSDKDVYVLDTTEDLNPRPHVFEDIPVFLFQNNDLEQSDFQKVGDLIDAYDIILSDALNELEEFRLAYMLFYGTEPDQKTLEAVRKTGAFGLDKDDKVEYLTKQINDGFLENTKKTFEKNIFRFARAVDMSDENFSGSAQTGESRKWKLVDLENKCKQKERKFDYASKEQFRVINNVWRKLQINYNIDTLELEFKRNLPRDLKYEAETTQILKGNVSEETRLNLLTFIDNPEREIELMQDDGTIGFDELPNEEQQ
jgi:SPP1 family phage portal protein